MGPRALAESAQQRDGLVDRFGRSWLGRTVAVIGLGKSGVAAARLLCRKGCRVLATDAREPAQLDALRESLLAFGVQEVETGGHSRRLIEAAELVVVSPGIPDSTGPVQWALQRSLPVWSEIELAFQFCPAPVVAVTGTNGKSTAVTLIAELLKASGRSAIACGNIGIPFSSVVDELVPQSVAVVEVSSFQLLNCESFRPKIGVLLNVGTNHLDRHHDRVAYLLAKARLFRRQTPDDWAVLNAADPQVVAVSGQILARPVWFGENRSNRGRLLLAPETLRSLSTGAQAVLQVARLLGAADPLVWQVIRSFRGLEHRLESVASIHGAHFINDSKSTTPDSLRFALSQVHGPVILILGGRDKGMDFHALMAPLHEERVKGIVLIGESRPKLRALLNGSTLVRESGTLEEAVQTAAALTSPGTTVLFSPAYASFDMFRDFEERGRAFKAAVRTLAGRTNSHANGQPATENGVTGKAG